ncbi:hypothetical protein PN451_12675 [Dolichospermum planctonicum CS-1226]|uniref:Uncharacterized protein n=1 Tax=Dolichospermum planctonicum CS-1226 TaxID=3021751 RepID=A0ABT5AH99_9CYAN|nr:hypothetical protein [Dolichospermum planctonicum]MDB9536670.1 hypothetical protein [Dolichospermum planctonicum CS-1226]
MWNFQKIVGWVERSETQHRQEELTLPTLIEDQVKSWVERSETQHRQELIRFCSSNQSQ